MFAWLNPEAARGPQKKLVLPNQWRPRPYQQNLWQYLMNGGTRAMCIWHRRAGKDDVLLNFTACAANKLRVGNYWHMLPEYKQARKAIWEARDGKGIRRIDQAFPLETRKRWSEVEMFIEFHPPKGQPTGSTWQLVGSDNVDSLVGSGPIGVVMSEYALSNPSAFSYLQPMLEENGGFFAAISTPRGMNHAYRLYNRAVESMQSGGRWFAERLTIEDTGQLSEERLNEILLDYQAQHGLDVGQARFDQEYMCDWFASILGAYYGVELPLVRQQGRVRHTTVMPGVPVHVVLDIGMSDDTALIAWQMQGSRPVIVWNYKANGRGAEHYAEQVAAQPWANQLGYLFVPHDAKVREWGTGRSRIETLQGMGFRVQRVPELSKADGIEAARRTLAYVVFDTLCDEDGMLLDSLASYRRKWDDDTKSYSREEVKDWSVHFADAFRYMALCWRLALDMVVETGKPQPRGSVVLDVPRDRNVDNRIKL